MCFGDILSLRVPDVPKISASTRGSITSIFDLYIKTKENWLQKASCLKVIQPLIENFLPSVFGMNQNTNFKEYFMKFYERLESETTL